MKSIRLKQFDEEKSAWVDQLLEKELNPVVLWLSEFLSGRMNKGKMNAFYRTLHLILGYFYQLEIDHAQQAVMKTKGFRKQGLFIKSVIVTVTLNKKEIGKKEIPLGLFAG